MTKIKVKQVDTLSRKPVSYAFAAFMRHEMDVLYDDGDGSDECSGRYGALPKQQR